MATGDGGAPPKILVVAEDYPWPANRGGLLRLSQVIGALADVGQVDLFTLYDPRRTDFPVPQGIELARLGTSPYPETTTGVRWRVPWALRRDLPLEVAMRAGDHGPRRHFDVWAADRYDLVWFDTAAVFAWLGRPRRGPTVVDLDDFEDEKARQWARVRGAEAAIGLRGTLRTRVAVAQATVNARRWRNLHRSVADRVDRVVLCTRADATRSGFAKAVVVPNTYPRPHRPVGVASVRRPATILLQGTLTYAPNMDAVTWLLDRVAPRLWSGMPEAEIRLVGNPAPGVRRWHRPPAVTVVGRVPDMEPELARADIAVVPLRVGSGTRIKILESFAHRIPVVSTTLGAEGLEVTDGVHLLVADEPEAFATACRRLLTDDGLRTRLADAAEDLYLRRYQGTAGRDAVLRVLGQLTGP